MTDSTTAPLSTTRGAALYIGALLGPSLLLLPGLAAVLAGPATARPAALGTATSGRQLPTSRDRRSLGRDDLWGWPVMSMSCRLCQRLDQSFFETGENHE